MLPISKSNHIIYYLIIISLNQGANILFLFVVLSNLTLKVIIHFLLVKQWSLQFL